ncbi:hypothetical protein NUW58_g4850 [Xylaria curta]|uniref:Uncharacterized protein n=1 Tax=Xylaria curta TaxID=42375 RepID=A0ACC1P529_9PEZI|nr:hypothetical protein NUW58_g4850 [Xylaria curta]
MRHLRTLAAHNKVAASLVDMIDRDGAGDWPPRANHESWPEAILPYRSIYEQLLPLLYTDTPSLDDRVNSERRERYRIAMRGLLRDKIDLTTVIKVLDEINVGNWTTISRDTLNGFYSCMAISRHAYRWATLPVVKVAQLEKIVDFPPELSVPWPYLQRYYGFTSDSGNHTSNVLMNFNTRGERILKFSDSLYPPVRLAEEGFFRLLYDIDFKSFDIFYDIAVAMSSFQDGNMRSCLESLRNMNMNLRGLCVLFSRRLREENISRKVWLNYVQSLHAWGAGSVINGEFTPFDGVSGNQIIVFQALDSLLGMKTYHSREGLERYVPASQRDFCKSISECSFRSYLVGTENEPMRAEFQALRFRAVHRHRIMPYLKNPASERYHMTTMASSLTADPGAGVGDALKPLDQMLIARLTQTV